MKEQMKYYINFAENSIHGHLDGVPRNMEAEHEAQVETLAKEMLVAKEEIRNLLSHNSELRSQLEVLAATATAQSSAQSTRESSGGPNTPIANQELDETNSHATREMSTTPSLPSHMSPKLTPESGPSRSSNTSSFTALPSKKNSDSETLSQYEIINNQQLNQNNYTDSKLTTSGDHSTAETHMLPGAENGTATPGTKVESSCETIPPLSPEVALLKLQHKFKKAMQDNVELSTEKEQLEHLVVQLQEETDTIGEYITIYQHQRQQQRLNLAEKEAQLQALSRDREDLKNKLNELQLLVKHFLKQEKRSPTGIKNVDERTGSLHINNNRMESFASSTTSLSSENENDSNLSSNPSTPRNLHSVSTNVNTNIKSPDYYEVAEEASECASFNNNVSVLPSTPKTKAVIVNGQNTSEDFEITSIPEGSDLQNNLNEKVSVFQTIVLPESESNCAEEIIIVPQKSGNIGFDGTENSNKKTADKILALISEIGSNQILQNDDKNFHPWFWEQTGSPVMTI